MARRQKPPIAAWIQRERKRLGLSTKQLSERLALVGAKVGEQTISVWESYAGRKPSADNLDALERIFGVASPEPLEATEGGDAVARALMAQTEAISRLAASIEAQTNEIRVAALTVLSAQAGTGDLLAQLVSAAEQGTLGELVRGLRDVALPGGQDR